jgi:hypothetical protein
MVAFLNRYRQELDEVKRGDEEDMLFDADELASNWKPTDAPS